MGRGKHLEGLDMEQVREKTDFKEILFSGFNSRQTLFKVQTLSWNVLHFLALFLPISIPLKIPAVHSPGLDVHTAGCKGH